MVSKTAFQKRSKFGYDMSLFFLLQVFCEKKLWTSFVLYNKGVCLPLAILSI